MVAFSSSLQPAQPGHDLLLQRGGIGARLDDALALAAFEIQEQAGQPQRIGPRPRPVHVAQPFGAAVGAGLQRQIALAQQPLIQVDPAAERAEAVIGDDHQHVAVLQLRPHAADQRIVVKVQLADGVLVRGLLAPAPGGMPGIDVAPEHVLDAIGGVEDADQGALAKAVERGEEHRLALAIDVVRLLQERPIVGDAFVEAPRYPPRGRAWRTRPPSWRGRWRSRPDARWASPAIRDPG